MLIIIDRVVGAGLAGDGPIAAEIGVWAVASGT